MHPYFKQPTGYGSVARLAVLIVPKGLRKAQVALHDRPLRRLIIWETSKDKGVPVDPRVST